MTSWSLQDAKNRFSAVVNAALAGEPQRVTRRGEPVVVVSCRPTNTSVCAVWKKRMPLRSPSCYCKSRKMTANSNVYRFHPVRWTFDVLDRH